MVGKSNFIEENGDFYIKTEQGNYIISTTSSSIIIDNGIVLDNLHEITPDLAIIIAKKTGIPIILPDEFLDERYFVV